MKEKTNKVESIDKTLVGKEESTETVTRRCFLNKVF